MEDIRKKIDAIAVDDSSGWLEDAKYRRANRKWLRKSQSIALRILDVLDEKGMQQKQLAEAMGVSPQQISKIVKGKQNLTLETISKLEQILGVALIEVPKFQTKVDVERNERREIKPSNAQKKSQRVKSHSEYILSVMQIWTPNQPEDNLAA